MERLSFELTTRMAKRRPTVLVALRASQRMLPIFLVHAAVRLALGCVLRRVALVHLGDPVLAPLRIVARAFGVPVAVTLHGLDVVHPQSTYRLWRRLFLRGFARYICISEAVRRVALEAGLPADRLVVIGAGVDAKVSGEGPGARAQRESQAVRGGRDWNTLLFVGRLVRRKGLGWFVAEVLPDLARRRPALRLAIIGDGPERAAVIAAARSRGVENQLLWVEPRSDAGKARWMARAGLCIVPNVAVPGDIEGLGIVALEAAAAGCPILAADVDGLPDAVGHGRAGTLVRSGDARAWIQAIEERIADPSDNERIGVEAQRYVLASCSWERVVDDYEHLFATLALGENGYARA